MLKNLGYYGIYRDQNISISVLLENPLHCGLEPSKLVFSVIVKDKQEKEKALGFEDCTFYIMDEQDHIYNAEKLLGVQPEMDTLTAEDEATRRPDGLIFADFRPEFLFQDIRVVAYCEAGQQFRVIPLRN